MNDQSNTHVLPAVHQGDLIGFGRFTLANPAGTIPEPPRARRLIAWAGWLEEAKADPDAGQFQPDFQVWTKVGWDALRQGLARALPSFEQLGSTLCLRPHAGCVLSDPQSCLNFLRDDPPARVELLLDPVAMITPDMLEHAEDHLARAFEAVGDEPTIAERVVGCVLASPRLQDGRVVHGSLVNDRLGPFIRDAWARTPLVDKPVLVTDPRDAPA